MSLKKEKDFIGLSMFRKSRGKFTRFEKLAILFTLKTTKPKPWLPSTFPLCSTIIFFRSTKARNRVMVGPVLLHKD
ncbi:hypothetical protein BCR42DRAFT_426299 [Absidia repens]|uniref:Uncharacterized protein n=1 Tax=Absidia repens TaxID=90262 RepID=A0A1X2I1P1_9FUNG|nr:hypothetical protein BCR42DRAFT_426299 [Absidia repens]